MTKRLLPPNGRNLASPGRRELSPEVKRRAEGIRQRALAQYNEEREKARGEFRGDLPSLEIKDEEPYYENPLPLWARTQSQVAVVPEQEALPARASYPQPVRLEEPTDVLYSIPAQYSNPYKGQGLTKGFKTPDFIKGREPRNLDEQMQELRTLETAIPIFILFLLLGVPLIWWFLSMAGRF